MNRQRAVSIAQRFAANIAESFVAAFALPFTGGAVLLF
jgi:hypothetical protein